MSTTRIVLTAFAITVMAFILARFVIFDFVTVYDDSMFPAVRTKGIVWVMRTPYNQVDEIQRGDVIGFTGTSTGGILLRRVIGLPGEQVSFQGRKVMINGRQLEMKSLGWDGDREVFAESRDDDSWAIAYDRDGVLETMTATVPPGAVFVLSDLRIRTTDSRAFGSVDFARVRSRSF